MKKTLLILTILVTLLLAGVLYGTQPQTTQEKRLTRIDASLDHFPDPMPEVIMDPMVGMPLL
jgi:hypothetical protein